MRRTMLPKLATAAACLMLASCGGVLGMLLYRRKKAVAGK